MCTGICIRKFVNSFNVECCRIHGGIILQCLKVHVQSYFCHLLALRLYIQSRFHSKDGEIEGNQMSKGRRCKGALGVRLLFLQLQLTLTIILYYFQVYSSVVIHLCNLQSEPSHQSRIHLALQMVITILLTIQKTILFKNLNFNCI